MLITAVKLLKNGRWGLFEGESFIISLDDETLAKAGLHEGDELGAALLESLRAEAEGHYAKEKALLLLSFRDHSKEELRRKLERTVGAEAAGAAADRMAELGLVDDAKYAEKLAQELLISKGYGRSRAVYEMTRKGLDRELVLGTVEALDVDPAERAVKFIQKKYPRGIEDENARRRAAAALSRCGYAWDDIRRALKFFGTDEQDAD